VAFDDFGNAFMVGEPIHYVDRFGIKLDTIGMFIYKSTDGGLHWSAPFPLHVGDLTDDKSWIACDNNPASPHYGNVYIAWGAQGPLRFARSTDHGQTWKGSGSNVPGDMLVDHTFAPEISVGLDGTVHIVWYFDGEGEGNDEPGTSIEYLRSTDGGTTFHRAQIVTGVHGLRGNLPEIGDPQTGKWPHFPGATFRVITLATGCAFGIDPLHSSPFRFISGPKDFAVAWSDFRDGAARIYYRISRNAGASFEGPSEGQPLLGSRQVDLSVHHFHPQIVCTGSGVIGCAYYEYGPKGGRNLIDVKLSASFDKGATFPHTATVTEKPWDPAVDAPLSHGDKQVTFIGEYFGLDADDTGFNVLWTDTRTGVQELFYARLETERYDPPPILQGVSAEVLLGVIQDGGGLIFVNGHFRPVPPRGPEQDLLQALSALDTAGKISGPPGRALTRSVYAAIAAIAKSSQKSVRG
jgi:hypothetical protein